MTHDEIEAFLRRLRDLCPEFDAHRWTGAHNLLDGVTCFFLRRRPSSPFLRLCKVKDDPYHIGVVFDGYASTEEELEERLRIARKLGDMAILLRRVLNPLDTEEKDHEPQ